MGDTKQQLHAHKSYLTCLSIPLPRHHNAFYFHTFPNRSSCPNPVVCTAPDVAPPALNAPHSSSSLPFPGIADVADVIATEGEGLFIFMATGEPHAFEAFPTVVPQADSLFAAVEIVGAGVAHAFVSNENCGVVDCLGGAALKLNAFMAGIVGCAGVGAGVEEKSNRSSSEEVVLGFKYDVCLVVFDPKNPPVEVGDN